jgi:hypothetical protein
MFVHAVYFWLKPGLDAGSLERFAAGLSSLLSIPAVRHGWVGTPAATDRPIIERSYSYALTLVLDDLAGHDEYQVHPLHERFVEEFADHWEKVVIYDSAG